MGKYILLALNGPTADADVEDLDRWYEAVHLTEFRAITEVKTARRYKVIRGVVPGQELWPSCALYEIETDDIAAVSAKFGKETSPLHPGLDRTKSAHMIALQIAGDA